MTTSAERLDEIAQIQNLTDALAAEFERGELGEDFPIDQLGDLEDALIKELGEDFWM